MLRANKIMPGQIPVKPRVSTNVHCCLQCWEKAGINCFTKADEGPLLVQVSREYSCSLCGISTCQNLSFWGKMCGI